MNLCANCSAMATDTIGGTHVCESVVCRQTLLTEPSKPSGQPSPDAIHPLVVAESRLTELVADLDDAFEASADMHTSATAAAILSLEKSLATIREEGWRLRVIARPCHECDAPTTREERGVPCCSDACRTTLAPATPLAELLAASIDRVAFCTTTDR